MKLLRINTWLLTILATIIFYTLPTKAQVIIGNEGPPKPFSILELISKDRGLRLPRLTLTERNGLNFESLFVTPGPQNEEERKIAAAAGGLMIYNITSDCLEFWNGTTWISLCAGSSASDCVAITGVTLFASETTVNDDTPVTLTASVTPSGAADLIYRWESYNAAIESWDEINTTGNPTEDVNILTIGDNKFLVTVSNDCSCIASNEVISFRESPPEVIGGSAGRLTWDPINGQYTITYDPRDAGLYFKFGSVVGIFSDHGKNWNFAQGERPLYTEVFHPSIDVAWTPENLTYSDFYIPYLDASIVDDIESIDENFHTAANVKAGMGDPCRLIGLDLDYIKNTMSSSESDRSKFDNGKWRMPTREENEEFIGNISGSAPVWWGWQETGSISFGVPGGEFPEKGHVDGGIYKFLPAAGGRSGAYGGSGGQAYGQGNDGHYYTNELLGAGMSFSYILSFDEWQIDTEFYIPGDGALPIRCVTY